MFSRTLSRCCHSSLNLKLFRVDRHLANRQYSDKSTNEPTNETPDEASKITELLHDAANFKDSKDKSWSTTPYPEGAPSSLEDKPERIKQDPSEASILLFPGQGTLKVGMIERYMKFPRVKDLYESANEALGYDLAKLCLHGPQEKLNRTEFNQPATVVASLAALERLWEERPRAIDSCKAAAGYSVGEITALIFSGAITIDDGIRLAGVRGAAMQAAAEAAPQGMLSVLCAPSCKVSKACESAAEWAMNLGVENPVCRIAIYQYTQGKIIAGHEEALRYLETNAETLGLRKLRRLPVSGAFHTALMEPAVKPFMKALGSIGLEEPRIEVYSNVRAKPYSTIRDIKRNLPKQIISPVKWEQIMHLLYQRPPGTAFPRTFDLGSGGMLRSLLTRINLKACEHFFEI